MQLSLNVRILIPNTMLSTEARGGIQGIQGTSISEPTRYVNVRPFTIDFLAHSCVLQTVTVSSMGQPRDVRSRRRRRRHSLLAKSASPDHAPTTSGPLLTFGGIFRHSATDAHEAPHACSEGEGAPRGQIPSDQLHRGNTVAIAVPSSEMANQTSKEKVAVEALTEIRNSHAGIQASSISKRTRYVNIRQFTKDCSALLCDRRSRSTARLQRRRGSPTGTNPF